MAATRSRAPAGDASLWTDTASPPDWEPLERDLRTGVLVIGAGITGLTTAVLLAREGAEVALVEAHRAGAGATGYTTAKLSSLHGLTYADLLSSQGEELARAYADANEAGIASVVALAGELEIECDLRRKSNFTYSEAPGEVAKLEREVEAALRLDLPARLDEQLELPFAVAAVRFDRQAEFHPLEYLAGLARAAADAGVLLFGATRAVGLSEGTPCRVWTDRGHDVQADDVVVATHAPFLDRGLYFARTRPERSYVVAGRTDRPPIEGMYLSTEERAHSIREHALPDGRRFVLVGGEGHKTGQGDASESYRRLTAYASERFGIQPDYQWATQDFIPADGMPFIGRLHPRSRNVYTATGYRKWGLAIATSAARLIADLIAGRDNDWAEAFEPGRLRLRRSVPSIAREGIETALQYGRDLLAHHPQDPDAIEPGEGAVVGTGPNQRAVYRSPDGAVHELGARCSHLGCVVRWNRAERAWDCPCHGSRFTPEGEVLAGPASKPLERKSG